MPQPYCDYWTPATLWIFVGGALLTGLVYCGIPILLMLIVRYIRLQFEYPRWVVPMMSQLALFILFCGGSHLIGIFNIWIPVPIVRATWELGTGLVSLSFFVSLLFLIRSYSKDRDGMG